MSLFQSVVGKDEAGGEVDGGEGGAVAEGRAADRGDAGGEVDGGEGGALEEGVAAYSMGVRLAGRWMEVRAEQ